MAQTNHKIYLEPAYLLHQRPYRDSSLLLEIFSRQHGRVGLVAHGVRGKNRQRQVLLQPFVPLLLSWSGRGELATLTDVEANGAAHRLNGQVLLSGFYLNELLTHLLHRHDPHPDLFDHYLYTLIQLDALLPAADNLHLQRLLRMFEKELLQEIGYGLVLENEVERGDEIEADAEYRYLPGQGPLRCTVGDKMRFKGRALLDFAAADLGDGESLKQAKRLTRMVLDHYLGGRKLHSRQLLLDLQRTTDAARIARVEEIDESEME